MLSKGKLIFTLIAVLAISLTGVGAMRLAGTHHAAPVRTAGVGATVSPEPTDTPDVEATDTPDPAENDQGEDVSGKCDEPEDAQDGVCATPAPKVEDQNDNEQQ